MVTQCATSTSLRVNAQLQKARAAKTGTAVSTEMRQDYAAARLAELIEREMAKAPPLRTEQIDAIQRIISGADVLDATGLDQAGEA